MTSNDNRRRAFAEVVSIDAWHKGFSENISSVDLHADVSFDTARIGGEDNSPVRFRLSIKRAEIVVIIPEYEPVSIDKSSVSRDFEPTKKRYNEKIVRSSEMGGKSSADLSIDPKKIDLSVNASASANAKIHAETSIESSEDVFAMIIRQSQTSEGFYRWIIESRKGEPLVGKPWDSIAKPRLKLVDKRKAKNGIPPTVRVELRCLREDLIISEIELKDVNLWDKAKSEFGFKNKIIAVEAYIRQKLIEEGLEVRDISDKFAKITLGSAVAASE